MNQLNKDHAMIVRTQQPLNMGTPLHLLAAQRLTPTPLFFVRNHAPIPIIDPNTYRLTVDGLVDTALSLSLNDLRTRFESHCRVEATLQCAGNRRTELIARAPIPDELPWDTDAIGTATWEGVRLRDVLEAAGIKDSARHIAFVGLDQVVKQDKVFGFGGSIPLDKALSDEVLLVHTMNGEPLPMEHGYPLRVLVPGYIGARSVKWLSRITIQAEPSDNYYQAHAYKLFPPSVNERSVDWSGGVMLDHLNVNAVIFTPTHDETLRAGKTRISGYALTGHGRQLTQVCVSADGGARWHTITLNPRPPQEVWSWLFWETDLELPTGSHEIVAYAVDSAGDQQPSEVDAIWNFKGYMNNVWHRVPVQCT